MLSRGVPRVSDGLEVRGISTLLEPIGRVDGSPARLAENTGITYEGCKPYGQGFVITASQAAEWLELDAKNMDVLFPYLNGDDLNSRPTADASRWVIDFNDRSEDAAMSYRLPFQRAFETVKPERARKAQPVREAPWWLFWRARPALRAAIAGQQSVMVIALTSKTVMPVRVSTGQVFSNALGVFAMDSYSDQAVLSSSLHQMWAIKYGSGLRNDPRYTPSDVFETFPRPKPTSALDVIGQTLDFERREIMLRCDFGLTKLYNLVNDPEIADSSESDVARLREIHVELDQTVMAAYGWGDVPLDHGFYTYRQMRRWTVSPAARVEILDRLLEENHRRAALLGEAPPPADFEDDDSDSIEGDDA
jgi:hypothetical protein